MSDEKTTIYISPEEDLTSVRERLEKIPARYITLVIPTETLLRSHVAWKLLRARVRELGKEVQIVSTNPQIRSVAKDVNFKVAPSLEASPTGKSRPPSRGGRPAAGKSRPANSAQQRTMSPRGQARDAERTRQPGPTNRWPSASSFAQPGSSDAVVEDNDLGGDTPQASSPSFNKSFNSPPDRSQTYDFHIDTSPPIRPLSSQHIDEEPDLWFEDFNQAQNIREAASQSGSNVPEDADDEVDAEIQHTPPAQLPFAASPPYYPQTPRPHLGADPFTAMNDSLSPPSLEQQGSIPTMDHFNTQEHTIQDVPDMPSDMLYNTIEDSGNQSGFVVHSDTPPAHPWGEPIAEDEQDRVGPPRARSVRPRGNRPGRRPSAQIPPVVPESDFDGDDALPSISDRPTQITPQQPPVQPAASGTARPSRELSSPQETRMSGGLPSTRISGAMPSPNPPQGIRMGEGSPSTRMSGGLPRTRAGGRDVQGRPVSGPASRSSSMQAVPSGRNRAVLSRPGTRLGRGNTAARLATPVRARSTNTGRRGIPRLIYGIVAAIVVVVILLALLFYIVPSANVTVVLPAQNYSAPVKLIASPNSQTNDAAGTIQAPTVKKDFTINGTGQTSGTTRVGTASANGIVFFTNNGNQRIIIPSGIIITTSSGIQFVTQDEIALGAKGSNVNSLPSTVQAKVSGDSGNVLSGSITVIPTSSATQIAQNNNVAASALNLQVNNAIATTGGGAGTAPMVTQKDLDNTQTSLSAQLQNSVDDWLKTQLAPGDVVGKPVVTRALTHAPKVNTVLQSDTFPVGLAENVEVTIVRSSALQAAAIAQLNNALSKDQNHQNYQIASAAQPSTQPLQIPPLTPVSNGLSMTLNFTPTGKIIQKISSEAVQSNISGKTPHDVEATLKRMIPGIDSVKVTISPSFFPWTPQLPSHITVNFIGR